MIDQEYEKNNFNLKNLTVLDSNPSDLTCLKRWNFVEQGARNKSRKLYIGSEWFSLIFFLFSNNKFKKLNIFDFIDTAVTLSRVVSEGSEVVKTSFSYIFW